MMVQGLLQELTEDDAPRMCVAYCSMCHGEVGDLDVDELRALMTGKWGDIICFNCEDTPPRPWTKLSAGVRRKLVELFATDHPEDLPVHSNAGWTNDREDVALQLSRNYGWSFWLLSPDGGHWQLRKVHASASEASALKNAYEMLPCLLK